MEVIKNCEGSDILPYLQAKKLAFCTDAGGCYPKPLLCYSRHSRQREFQFHIHSPRSSSPRGDADWTLYSRGFGSRQRKLTPKKLKSFIMGCNNTRLTFACRKYYLHYTRQYTNLLSAGEEESPKIRPSMPFLARREATWETHEK